MKSYLTKKQEEMIRRFAKGDYGVQLDDASMWRWKSDLTRMNSSVVHSLWDKRLIDQTYTSDARMLLTDAGKKVARGRFYYLSDPVREFLTRNKKQST